MSAPSQPNIQLHPMCSDQIITFFWTPPSNSGDAGLSNYVFSCDTPSIMCNYPAGGPATYAITGLTNGTDYQFSLTAQNSNNNSSIAVYFRSVQPGVQSAPPAYAMLTSAGPTAGLALVQRPTNTGSAQAKWLEIITIDPVTGQRKQFSTAGYNTTKYLPGLTNTWYKFYVQAVNDAGKSYQPPGQFQYYNYPQQFNTGNIFKVWLDYSQQPTFVNGITGDINKIPNFAVNSLYTFTGIVNMYPSYNFSTLQLGFTNGYNANSIHLSNGPLTSEEFTLCWIPYEYVGYNNGGPALSSSTHPDQALGYYMDNTNIRYKGICQLDGTQFVSSLVPSDFQPDIMTVSRKADTGFVTFRWNGSTISTSGQALSTLTDIYWNQNFTQWGSYPSGWTTELLYYTSSLSLDIHEKLEGYLAWKWGLTQNLPPTHPYKNTRPQ